MNLHCGSKKSIIGVFPLGVCMGTQSLRDRLYVKIIQPTSSIIRAGRKLFPHPGYFLLSAQNKGPTGILELERDVASIPTCPEENSSLQHCNPLVGTEALQSLSGRTCLQQGPSDTSHGASKLGQEMML